MRMDTTAAIIVIVTAFAGVGLTVLTLPGIWFSLAVAAACWLWRPELFAWETLVAVLVIGVVAEVLELVASAAGAAKMGGTKRGAIGSVIGAFIGAIGGTFVIPIPVVGTILGGALGAGIGALVFERHGGRMGWKDSMKVGSGAAAGRLVATLMKTGFALLAAVILTVGVLR